MHMASSLRWSRPMRPGLLLALCAVVLVGSACGLRSVHSYTGRGVNLEGYRHYTWAPASRSRTGDPRLDNNEIFREHVREMIDRRLIERGFVKDAPGLSPDVVVHYHTSINQDMDLHELAPWDVCPECTPFVFDAGTLVIDLVDARSEALVWRGWAEGNITGLVDDQAQLEAEIDRAIARILAPLPAR